MRIKLRDDSIETERQSAICKHLKRLPSIAFVVRINSGCARRGKTIIWFYRIFIGGKETIIGKNLPDIIGMTNKGRFFAIDVKCKGEPATPGQQEVIDLINRKGGLAGTAETPMEAEKVITGGEGGG